VGAAALGASPRPVQLRLGTDPKPGLRLVLALDFVGLAPVFVGLAPVFVAHARPGVRTRRASARPPPQVREGGAARVRVQRLGSDRLRGSVLAEGALHYLGVRVIQ